MKYKKLPRHPLGFFPTPIVEAKRLSAHLNGPRIFIKRDDHTGLAFGGNKTRKLEYLIGDALLHGCDTVITGGAAQSNHCRQTAAAAVASGLKCHLVLGGKAPKTPSGNLLLDYLFGAEIHWTGILRKGEKIPEISQDLMTQGKKPYIVPYGGSNIIGAAAFVEATREVCIQLENLEESVSHIVFPSSSGGTQAGLIVGKRICDQDFNLIGIDIDKDHSGDSSYQEHIFKLAKATAEALEVEIDIQLSDINIRSEYVGGGYGVVGEAERYAIKIVAETEGILLDPVYTGRAMAGLIDIIKSGEVSRNDTVLFWHTGGTPALFAYAQDLI